MKKVKYKTYPLVFPLPAVVVGARVENRVNFMTLGDCGIVSVKPPVLYISSNKSHFTNQGIHEYMCFSVNIPSVELMEKVDYCGLVSGRKYDKSSVFRTFLGVDENIPMIEECPVSLACKVREIVEVYNMEVFIADIIETYVCDECFTNGLPDTKKINPLIYCMDNLYWCIGDNIGQGYKAGRKVGPDERITGDKKSKEK